MLVVIGLSSLDGDLDAISKLISKEIYIRQDTTVFYIIEKVKETILDFS